MGYGLVDACAAVAMAANKKIFNLIKGLDIAKD
jgi:hypothetical protein